MRWITIQASQSPYGDSGHSTVSLNVATIAAVWPWHQLEPACTCINTAAGPWYTILTVDEVRRLCAEAVRE